jgi:prepilin peptidase CpaA
MQVLFFPGAEFGWTYCVALIAALAVAAVIDLRSMRVPKWLTLTTLGVGLVTNLVRGAWLGSTAKPVWILGSGGAGIGALDGFLFAGAGFLLGFGLMLLLWLLGTCGGGDVKLFAALGTWVGPLLAVAVLTGTIILIAMMVVGRLLSSFFTGGFRATFRAATNTGSNKAARRKAQSPKHRLITYSLPLAVVTAVVLFWVFRVELRLAPAKEAFGERIHASTR